MIDNLLFGLVIGSLVAAIPTLLICAALRMTPAAAWPWFLVWPSFYSTWLIVGAFLGRRPWSEEARLERRLFRAERETVLIQMRADAEKAEARTREVRERYLNSPVP